MKITPKAPVLKLGYTSKFDPERYSEQTKSKIKDVLLFQRPLLPIKPGRCTLIPEEPRAPIALPSQQQFRIYQELNNLRIFGEDQSEQTLSLEQRNILADLLNRSNKATFKAMRKALKLPALSVFNLEDEKRKELKGNLTAKILSHKDLFGDAWFEWPLSKQDEIVEKLVNEESEPALIDWLQEQCESSPESARRASSKSLPDGYGRLSVVALKRILPYLTKLVMTYAAAVTRAGFESHSALSHFEQTGEIMDSLPYYGIPLQRHVGFSVDDPQNDEQRYGKIANPTVHIGLNQIRIVVNAIIRRYGHPEEVVVEVARDLKLGKKVRDQIQREQAANQKRNQQYVEEACEILDLNPDTLDTGKRRALSQKIQLWVELNPGDPTARNCPFTGRKISIQQLLSNQVEIEHIFPFSRSLDDSMANKTVCYSRANRLKSNQTPAEAYSGEEYEKILIRTAHMPRNKAYRFRPDGYEKWLRDNNDFLARALNDTRYLSRLAHAYISRIRSTNCIFRPKLNSHSGRT